MIEAPIYNLSGKNKGKAKLPEQFFGLPWNDSLMHQVIVSYNSNERQGTAHAKDRSEVSATGKKPWPQKGRGLARHGSKTSPIWRGGGVAFGPRKEKSYTKIINTKQKNKALFVSLSQKARDNDIVIADDFIFEEPKTKVAKKFIDVVRGDLKTDKGSFLIVLPDNDFNIRKSFSNIPKVETTTINALNAKLAAKSKTLVLVDKDKTIEELTARKS